MSALPATNVYKRSVNVPEWALLRRICRLCRLPVPQLGPLDRDRVNVRIVGAGVQRGD